MPFPFLLWPFPPRGLTTNQAIEECRACSFNRMLHIGDLMNWQFLQRRAIERQAYTCREQFVSRGDKAVRAQSMRGRMAMLGLYVRQGAPWFADLRAELLSFPAGKHDDQVDALGLVGQLLDRISAKQKPKPPEFAHDDDYRSASDDMPDVSSSVKLL